MIKKVVSLVVVSALLCSISLDSFAEGIIRTTSVSVSSAGEKAADPGNAKISKEKALEIAKKIIKEACYLEVDEKKYETRIEYRQDYGPSQDMRQVWDFNFNTNDNEMHRGVQVTVDADKGKVTGFYKYEHFFNSGNQLQVASITEEQARKIADDFVKKMNPDEYKALKYIDDSMSKYGYMGDGTTYTFRYAGIINNIEFDGNSIIVGIDGRSGTPSQYNYSWRDAQNPPEPKDIIEKNKAGETLKSNISMLLQYIPVRNRFDYGAQPAKIKVAYSPDYKKGFMVDAKTGKMIDYSGMNIENQKIKDLSPAEREELYKSAVQTSKSTKELDKEKAEVIFQPIIAEVFGSSYDIESVRYMENEQGWGAMGRPIWMAQVFKKGDSSRMQGGGTVVIDATTGQLISADKHFYPGIQEEKFDPKITWEEAYIKALKSIEKFYPDKVKNIKTEQVFTNQYYYINNQRIENRIFHFYFPRLVNGIMYSDNSVGVEIDAKTGEINGIRSNWDDTLKFPGVDTAISKEEALKIFFENNEPELYYTMVEKNSEGKPDMEIKLVYRLKNTSQYYPSGYIDANSGKILDFLGEETGTNGGGFKERITGHWAEKELSILGSQGIIDVRNFDPEGEATVMDAIKLLVNAKGYTVYSGQVDEALKFTNIKKGDPDYRYLQMAIRYKLINNTEVEFKGDAKVSRQDMAEMIVKLIQYNKIAKALDIFVLPYKDARGVSPDKTGYVAVCRGLGIMEGYKGYFRPKKNISKAELAMTVYKALGNIRAQGN